MFALAREIYGGGFWVLEPNTFLTLKAEIENLSSVKIPDNERHNSFSAISCRGSSVVDVDKSEVKTEDRVISQTNINGIITKSGGVSSRGMKELSAELLALDAEPNVVGHLFILDTPGGSALGMEYMQQTMGMLTKPKVGIVERAGMAASGGYGIISQCDFVLSEDENAEVGSAGTMFSFSGMPNGTADINGKKHFTVYATKSTEKNGAVEKAINEGDTSLVVEDLDKFNNRFHSRIKAKRSSIEDKHLTGAMFPSSEVVGTMIDAIGTKKDAINKILELSNTNNTFSKKNQKTAMTAAEFKSQHPESHAEVHAAGMVAGAAAEQERVRSWQVFAGVDQEKVNAGIASGKAMTDSERNTFLLAAASTTKLNNIQQSSAKDIVTPEADSTAKTPEQLAHEAEVKSLFGQFDSKVKQN